MTTPNVRRVLGSDNPNDRSYTGLGYVDKAGVYHLPDGRTLPATGGIDYPDGRHTEGGTSLVIREDGTPSTLPSPDGANPVWSALQRLHCVDRKQQDAYDLREFGEVGGDPIVDLDPGDVDPILPPSNVGQAHSHSPDVRSYVVGSPERDAAVAAYRQATHG